MFSSALELYLMYRRLHFSLRRILKHRKYTGYCFVFTTKKPVSYTQTIAPQQYILSHLIGHRGCVFYGYTEEPLSFEQVKKIANLISKLNFFYKLIPYPMDKCYSGRHRPARQTSEKDVLCFHRPAGP